MCVCVCRLTYAGEGTGLTKTLTSPKWLTQPLSWLSSSSYAHVETILLLHLPHHLQFGRVSRQKGDGLIKRKGIIPLLLGGVHWLNFTCFNAGVLSLSRNYSDTLLSSAWPSYRLPPAPKLSILSFVNPYAGSIHQNTEPMVFLMPSQASLSVDEGRLYGAVRC